jgi:hypothetical protein
MAAGSAVAYLSRSPATRIIALLTAGFKNRSGSHPDPRNASPKDPHGAVLYCTDPIGPGAYRGWWSVSMAVTNRTFGWAWLVVLCLVASSASGMIADRNIVWWVLGGILAPATLMILVARVWRPAVVASFPGGRAAVAMDVNDLMRMDSDKG